MPQRTKYSTAPYIGLFDTIQNWLARENDGADMGLYWIVALTIRLGRSPIRLCIVSSVYRRVERRAIPFIRLAHSRAKDAEANCEALANFIDQLRPQKR